MLSCCDACISAVLALPSPFDLMGVAYLKQELNICKSINVHRKARIRPRVGNLVLGNTVGHQPTGVEMSKIGPGRQLFGKAVGHQPTRV